MKVKGNASTAQMPVAAISTAQPNPHPVALTRPPIPTDQSTDQGAGIASEKAKQNGDAVTKSTTAEPDAAHGDDSLIIQLTKPVAASDADWAGAQLRISRWQGAVAQPSTKWSKISVDEFAHCDGREQPLAKQLERRFRLSTSDSHKQAREFLGAHA